MSWTSVSKINKNPYFLPVSFIVCAILLTLFGILMIYNASSFAKARSQVVWFGIALVAGFITMRIDFRLWRKLAWPMYCVSVFLLIIVLLPGIGDTSFGAQRWIKLPRLPLIGPVGFQPAEIAKISVVVFFSAWFSKSHRKKDRKTLTGFLGFIGLVVGLVMLEPDLGTTLIIISSVLVIYLLAREPVKYVLMLFPGVIVGVILLIMAAPYRLARLQSYFHFWSNPFDTPDQLGATYHIRQAIIGIGSGQFLGVGPGQSRQKYGNLPFAETDSIFAVIGEEFGFVGVTIFLLVFIFFLRQGFLIADRSNDDFARLLAAGFVTWFAVQVFLNVGAMSVLIPFTGVPLLFVSYGGSALVVEFIAIGILVNIALQSVGNQGVRVRKR
ncbi:MAG: putative lipid II flippase FtsW [bacterium]|nr:putative lipid II flippase FtsW [bacterium]